MKFRLINVKFFKVLMLYAIMAKKKNFLEIAGGVFLTGVGLAFVGNSNSSLLSIILGFLLIGIGLAFLLKD